MGLFSCVSSGGTNCGNGGWDPLGDISNAASDSWNGIVGGVDAILGLGKEILVTVWQDVGYPIVEAAFSVLGYEDEDIYTIQLVTIPLVTEEPTNHLAEAVMAAIKNEQDIVNNVQVALLSGPLGNINHLINYAKDKYYYEFPTIKGGFRKIDLDALDTVVTSVAGEAITITSSDLSFPTDLLWVKYYLQENESYTEDTSELFKAPDPIAWIYDGFVKEVSGEFTVNLQRDIVGNNTHNGTITDSGSHDGANDVAVLTDSTQAWTVNEWAGGVVTNNTDGSSATIISNTATTIVATLTGGTEDDWDTSDTYSLVRDDDDVAILEDTTQSWATNEWVGETLNNDTDGSFGTVTANTATTITATLTGGTDDDWDVGDNYSISRNETTTLGYLVPIVSYETHYNVFYTLDSDPSYTKFWLYKESLGTYPTLDNEAEQGQYWDAAVLPVIPLRKDFISVNSPSSNVEAYLSSKGLLDTINFDIDHLIEQLEDNDDIASIRDAFVLFAINLYTDTTHGQKLLFNFWANLYFNATVSKADYDANPSGAAPIFNTFSMEETSYNTAIIFNYITLTSNLGSIGELYSYETEIVVLPNTPYTEDDEGNVTQEGKINSYILLRYQNSINNYIELKVHGVFQLTNIFTTAGRVNTTLTELSTDDTQKANFIIPVSTNILKSMTSDESTKIIYESIHMIVYASTYQHLEFYETEDFLNLVSFVIIVIAVIYLVITWGESGGTAALLALAEAILWSYALQLILLEILDSYADDEAIRALAILTFVAATYYAADFSGMSTAESLLFGVNAVTQALLTDISIQANNLQQEIDAFTISAEERQEELEKAQDLLDNTSELEWWELVTYFPIDSYEKPDGYYERTIHTANPGVLTLLQVETFHDNLLQLPRLTPNSFDPVSNYE